MSHAKNKVRWCLNKARKELQEGKKHKGLVQREPDQERARAHIAKAEHNLTVTFYLHEGGHTDWCSSSLFYTIYHCFPALLAKEGYESRNQECTFAVIGSLIEDKRIPMTEDELGKVSSLDVSASQEAPTALRLREEYQYSTKVSLENREYEELLHLAKSILDKTKDTIER